MEKRPVIALLTDFGRQDAFVAVMEAVIAGVAPAARIIHIAHDLAPQDIKAAAFHLMTSAPYFPDKTLFVCVVDPGVGSERRVLFLEDGRCSFLVPDNGLVSWALKKPPQTLVSVENKRYFLPSVSQTFHARDIFAPVAARLASGLDPERLGPKIRRMETIPFPAPVIAGGAWEGEVIAVDRFGNLITNLENKHVRKSAARVRLGSHKISRLSRYYAEGKPGELTALVGSSGFLEIALYGGSASQKLACYTGHKVLLLR